MQQIQIDYKLADGREGRVDVPNRSRVQWDLTASKRKWPSFADVPSMWATFLAWDALLRAGEYDGKWEEFLDDCLIADVVGDDDAADQLGDGVDPTGQDQTPI